MKLPVFVTSQRGVTLIEIVASIAILFLIIVFLVPMFTQSARSTSHSRQMMNGTYVAEAHMETVYNLIVNVPPRENADTYLNEVQTSLTDRNSFNYTLKPCPSGVTGKCFEKNDNGHYVNIQLSNSGTNLVKVKVEVYNESKAIQQSKMETVLAWEK
ncbi:hypothetical protein A8F94_07460 [Bacillus sp. FJAT-27225]|uniref:type IV pilus modification PilV family protein n=1 Tax=Bacillus sp. FJAT-27225 TaxID=1743144 RepID=UPI00080C22F1|nr:type II secretion system protein [Bacillus sp. FJAT-27225]OCA87684.1 hypothetical protein A8F94_07460 [Bacillus sp. FJAT-27225]